MRWSAAFLTCVLLLACATPETVHRRSSLTAYLGGKATAPPTAGAVDLRLPLRLGIAFVPAEATTNKGDMALKNTAGPTSPDQEQELHRKVAGVFEKKPWAQSFKIIPSLYLSAGGGFEDLDQVSRSFGVDVIALVSVDQIQFSSPRWYSWTYWTVLGAYMIRGDKNDTATLADAAVYHVPSRTFLFRAGGMGTVKGSSTWAGREDSFRQQSRESVALAMADLGRSLDQGVEGFKKDLLAGARRDIRLLDKDGNPYGTAGYDPARK